MSFLLDTNVISELRKGRRCNPAVMAWFMTVPTGEICLSVLVLGELRRGIETVRRVDPRQAAALERWAAGLARTYADQILPVTQEVAEAWGRLNSGRTLPVIDGLLAATALIHGLTLVSGDTRGYTGTGVELLNPFKSGQ